jgi:hypothetical protein
MWRLWSWGVASNKKPAHLCGAGVGPTNAALATIEGQRKARAGFVDDRKQEAAAALAALQVERASVASKGRQVETALIGYVAELIGADADTEPASAPSVG